MTDDEKKELKKLRIDMQSYKEQLYQLDTAIYDVRNRRAFLSQWKHRSLMGFLISFGAYFFVLANIYFFAINTVAASANATILDSAAVFVTAMGSTVLGLLFLIHFVLLIFVVVSGLTAIAEMGNSRLSMALAELLHKRNYPSEFKKNKEQEYLLLREKERLQADINEIQPRLKELESMDSPWYGVQ
ncbi:MAG: hypothetical protein K6G19_10365 [Lachnospiraceae bacterium]|nr:hypothetical protein [Lachnospiraceae bacterium]